MARWIAIDFIQVVNREVGYTIKLRNVCTFHTMPLNLDLLNQEEVYARIAVRDFGNGVFITLILLLHLHLIIQLEVLLLLVEGQYVILLSRCISKQ
jgi:hypothetical protein